MAHMEPQFYSVAELASILNVHNSTIREQAAAGHLPAIRIGRLWRFPKKKIDAWLDEERPATEPAEEREERGDLTPQAFDHLMEETRAAAERAGYRTVEDLDRLIAEVRAERYGDTASQER
jgi:excisionase family DNA binding protein